MIGRLNGTLAVKRAPTLLVDCNGVGYEVDVPMSTFYQLPAEGEKLSLWTHLLIKEDQHALVGFSAESERALFRNLIKVSGVGPKMALAILSGISAADFTLCIQAADSDTLTRLPGIGKKTAQRLIIEMRDKLDTVEASSPMGAAVSSSVTGASHSEEAVEALVALGYKPVDARKMINSATAGSADASAEELIKQALQNAIA